MPMASQSHNDQPPAFMKASRKGLRSGMLYCGEPIAGELDLEEVVAAKGRLLTRPKCEFRTDSLDKEGFVAGIAGIIGVVDDGVKRLESMLSHVRHRGPDSMSIEEVDGGAIGCVASQTSHVATPAMAKGGELTVLLDGDIYNPRQDGVTNVELARDSYLADGADCLSALDGSFAAAFVGPDEAILVRDHVGARPLIYGEQNGLFAFASEAKALVGLVDEVHELSPGHRFSTREGLQPFNGFEPEVPDYSSPAEAARILQDLVREAVERYMEDQAVGGVSLSGGLDSSIVAALAAEVSPDVVLFTTTIKRYPGKDIGFARQMAEHLGLEHHAYEISDDDICQVIPEAIYLLESFDEDCVSGIIANYFSSKLIADHGINCVLVGEGADELFGGYFRELEAVPDAEKESVARKLVEIAYNTALRRLDRGWLGNSVNYRAPYLDPRVVAFSEKVTMDLQVRIDDQTGREMEKWVLREAFRDLLPPEIAERPKLRFAGGTGVDDLMDELTADRLSSSEFAAEHTTEAGLALNSPKELYYYRLFRDRFPLGYEGLTVRWDPFK